MSNKTVYRTAPATPGLLKILVLQGLGAICRQDLYQLCENVCLLNSRRVTGMLDWEGCKKLDANDLPSVVHLSP